jgi:hypothetical protein
MRQRNWRLIVVGVALFGAATGFFLYMGTLAPKSNDPAVMMQTVGQVSGVVCGVALVMLLFGVIGKRA